MNTAEKADFFEVLTQGGAGKFEAGNIDNITECLVIVNFGGSQKNTVLMNRGFALADAGYSTIFEGFIVVGTE